MKTLQPFPTDILESWQYRKVYSLHGRRLADLSVLTLIAFYRHVAQHGSGPVTEKIALRLGHAHGRRDNRRILDAMEQANFLRRSPEGYRLRALVSVVAPQPKVVLEPLSAPAQQLALPLKAKPKRQKTQQKQACGLARAGDMSAPLSEKPPLIEDVSKHTDFSEPTSSERSEADETAAQAGSLLGARSAAPNSAAQVGASFAFKKRAQAKTRFLTCAPTSRPKAVSVACEKLGGLGVSPVTRINDPRGRFIGERFPARRVNTRRVIKQQNRVNCREQSSAALAGEPQETRPPMLKPSAAEQPFYNAVEGSGIFSYPLRPQDVRHWMQQGFTLDEVVGALTELQRQKERGYQPKYPALLGSVMRGRRSLLADQAQERRAARRESQTDGKLSPLGMVPPAAPKPTLELVDSDPRAATCELINNLLGDVHHVHHLSNSRELAVYVTLLSGVDPDAVVSLYSEMLDVPLEDRWKAVASAYANGRRAEKLGQRPPIEDGRAAVAAAFAKLGIGLPSVQTKDVDKLAHTG